MRSKFLTLQEVLDLHADQIAEYGGTLGVRDVGLLQSALEMPRAMFSGQFLHEDLYAMAAAYLFHIVQNHPFIDGNKRVGLAATIWFLNLNGLELHTESDALNDLVMSVAEGNADKAAITKYLRENTR